MKIIGKSSGLNKKPPYICSGNDAKLKTNIMTFTKLEQTILNGLLTNK